MSFHKPFKRQESRGQPQSQPMERSGVTVRINGKEPKMEMASYKGQTLDDKLMERICERDNLNQAYKRVVGNAGAPGVDGMKTSELKEWLKINGKTLVEELLEGTYKPQGVRSVAIRKPGGGERWLGIPSVVDRLVQQAMLQVLSKEIDKTFDENSYGYRPGKSAHQALKKAQSYIEEGKAYAVDLDMERYFDTVNHDKVMSSLAKSVKDKRVLKLTRRYLQAGIWRHGAYEERREGTPQGGPLSPLLANLLLDKLDKELRKRGHKFCRYADDLKVYVGSEKAAERVLRSITNYVEKKLKLRVNREKSKASGVNQSTFLGYTLTEKGELKASKSSISRLKEKIRNKTQMRKGKEIEKVIEELNQLIRGWKAYFKYDQRKTIYEKLDGWIKRRLRSYRLRQRKKYGAIVSWLIGLGIEGIKAMKLACSGKGWWRLSLTPQLHMAMDNAWFVENGLISLQK